MSLSASLSLLGSIGSTKYLNLLLPIFGERLRVPAAFIGLGDMSRGELLLRHVREQREVDYIAASSIPVVRVPRPRPALKVSSPSISGACPGALDLRLFLG